jgi:hypothetical protein
VANICFPQNKIWFKTVIVPVFIWPGTVSSLVWQRFYLENRLKLADQTNCQWRVGHVIGERKKYIFYGECYLSAIMHKKMEFGLKKSKK